MSKLDLECDAEGYLVDLSLWSPEVGHWLAQKDGITLTDAHWEVIWALRDFYAKTDIAPAMRPFVKLVKDQLGAEQGNSIYLMQLFGSSPAKVAAKLAGLPRPTNCL